MDNCLCDACFRHVDRRANCPIYKKRTTNTATANSEYSKMLKAAGLDDMPAQTAAAAAIAAAAAAAVGATATTNNTSTADDCTSQPMDIEMPADESTATMTNDDSANVTTVSRVGSPSYGKSCQVVDCGSASAHSIRRKWYVKMRKQVAQLIQLQPEAGSVANGMLVLCGQHYNVLSHLLVCALCKRKMLRNHFYYINQVCVTGVHVCKTTLFIPMCLLPRILPNWSVTSPTRDCRWLSDHR